MQSNQLIALFRDLASEIAEKDLSFVDTDSTLPLVSNVLRRGSATNDLDKPSGALAFSASLTEFSHWAWFRRTKRLEVVGVETIGPEKV